jgi:hypothetical protein
MPASQENQSTPEPDRLEAATDEAIAACGGDARQTMTALIVANEFLEAQVRELQAAVSHGYPPDLQDAAVQNVLQQAEALSAEWAA